MLAHGRAEARATQLWRRILHCKIRTLNQPKKSCRKHVRVESDLDISHCRLKETFKMNWPMARPLRFEYKGALYHVHARGNERRKIFFSDTDYQKFKEYLSGAIEKYHCFVYCYILMDIHDHLETQVQPPYFHCNKMRLRLSGVLENKVPHKYSLQTEKLFLD